MKRASGRFALALGGLAFVVTLSGCATAYQTKGSTGGFSETMLAPDTFKVQFSGNAYTSAERASDFAVLRAADKSIELGCSYFGVVNEADGASVGSVTLGSAGWGHGGAWAFSNTLPVVKPNTALLVKCFRERQPGINLFDAHFIDRSIRSKYGLKPDAAYAAVAPTVASPAGPPSANEAPPATAHADPVPADYATMVLSAQRVSKQMGCGDVHPVGGTKFQASCTTYSVIIDCNSGSCRPIRSLNN
jgi:hypothetical protein